MSAAIPGGHDAIAFAGVSKFYGEVLGVNKVDLEIQFGLPRSSVPTVRARRR